MKLTLYPNKAIEMKIKRDTIIVIIMLAIVTGVAHFLHFNSLGLYEDDYSLVTTTMEKTWPDFLELIKKTIFTFFQGRVVGFLILYTVSFIGGHFVGLKLIYIIAYLFVLTNNILFYFFARSIWNQPTFAVFSTLAFTLFPADTTRAYLTHIHVSPAFTFLLLAFLCYFTEKKILSYIFAAACLMCYETVFPLFITAPLFKNKWTKEVIVKFFKHLLVIGLILGCTVIIRKMVGESRVTDLDIASTISTSISQTIVGPYISLWMFIFRPLETLPLVEGKLALAVGVFLIGLTWIFFTLRLGQTQENRSYATFRKLSILGMTVLLLAYPLTLTRLAVSIKGRDSRVHTAAAVGAAIVVGLVLYLIVDILRNIKLKNVGITVIAAFFSMLIAFGLTVQYDNLISWKYQQAFWYDVVQQAPDLNEGTVILVEAPHLSWGKQLNPFDWSLPSVLTQLFNFPPEWNWYSRPQLYKLNPQWQDTIGADGKLQLNNDSGLVFFYYTWEPSRLLETEKAILLREKDGKLVRQTEPLIVGDRTVQFKPLSAPTIQEFPRGILYNYLIKPSRDTSINYLKSLYN